MRTFFFGLGILFSLWTFIVFLLNYYRPRTYLVWTAEGRQRTKKMGHPASLVCAWHSLGWAVALARELQWLPRTATTFAISAAIPLSLLGLMIVLNARRQL